MMEVMPDDVRVWAVDLEEGSSLNEREGSLSLQADVLRFEPSKEGSRALSITLRDVTKAKRLKGSPVLLVLSRQGERVARTAFYFAQPPPLTAFTAERPDTRPSLAAFRNPKRKARRDNVGYLGLTNRKKKALVMEWEDAVRTAVAAARGR